VSALEGMAAMETSASGRYGILRDGPPSTALALPARRMPPFGSPPIYDGVPPPPAYDALDAGLARVKSRPHSNDSLLSTPVDMDYRPGPSRGAWWALASLGLVLLLLLTVGVWWQMLRERDQTDGSPKGPVAVVGDGGKGPAADDGKGVAPADGGSTKAVAGSTGPTEPDPSASSSASDDEDGKVVLDDGADEGGADDGGAATNPLESAKCKRTRQSAKEAYQRRAWKELLGQLGSKTCWKGKYRGDYADMKIKALFEDKQFAKCAALEKAARSSEAKNAVKICLQRVAMGDG
jgi:hypothetical protein